MCRSYIAITQRQSPDIAIDSFRKLTINLSLDVKSIKEEDSEERIVEQIVSWLQMGY